MAPAFCPKCGTPRETETRSCAVCGFETLGRWRCPQCGKPNAADNRFCGGCGFDDETRAGGARGGAGSEAPPAPVLAGQPTGSAPATTTRGTNPLIGLIGLVAVGAIIYLVLNSGGRSLLPSGGTANQNGSVGTGSEAHAPAGTYMAGGICYLVTNDEIAAVIGRAPLLGGGSGFELGGVRYCNWVTYADPVEGAGLTLNSAANHETGRILSPETVAGLGDDAYWLPPPLGQLSVKVGQYNLTVSVTSKQVDEKAAAIQIARDALLRLR